MAGANQNLDDRCTLGTHPYKKFKRDDGSARGLEDSDEDSLPVSDILDDTFEEKVKEMYLSRLGLIPRRA